MPPNLSSVFAQVLRKSRSNGSRRNFSSSPDSITSISNGSKGVSAGGGLNSSVTMTSKSSAVGIVAFTLLGYACFIGKEVLEARKYYKEYKLREQLHDELMSKAKRDLNL